MNFKGHLTAGIVTGFAVSGLASLFSPVTPWAIFQLTTIATLFALFPDLDTSSIPQRWFYRCVFVLLVILSIQGKYQLAALFAIVALMPILSTHRGWTHSPLAACLSPFVFAFFYEYLLTKPAHVYAVSLDKIFSHVSNHIWYVIACMLGWLSHLLLDSRLKLFKNGANHH